MENKKKSLSRFSFYSEKNYNPQLYLKWILSEKGQNLELMLIGMLIRMSFLKFSKSQMKVSAPIWRPVVLEGQWLQQSGQEIMD